jgi:putative intracellular protease/amidase
MILFICNPHFNPKEFWTTFKTLKRRGHKFRVASFMPVIHEEYDSNHTYKPDLLIEEVASEDYDALIMTSGEPRLSKKLWTDLDVHRVVTQLKANSPIAATCSAVPAIRYVAEGKHVSVFPLQEARDLITKAGGILSRTSVTVDGFLITSENEMMADTWSSLFCDFLEGKEALNPLSPSPFKRKLNERKPVPEIERLKSVTQGPVHLS